MDEIIPIPAISNPLDAVLEATRSLEKERVMLDDALDFEEPGFALLLVLAHDSPEVFLSLLPVQPHVLLRPVAQEARNPRLLACRVVIGIGDARAKEVWARCRFASIDA
jgi:hypothetical protein